MKESITAYPTCGARKRPFDRDMNAEVIRNWPELRKLEKEWNKLLQRSRANTIFLTWEWIRAWGKAAGHSYQPFVISVRAPDGKLTGLAPYYLAEFKFLRILSYKALRMMADQATGAEYPDWIVDHEFEDQVCAQIANALASHRGWDCIWMSNLAGWTGAFERITNACKKADFFFSSRKAEFAFIEFPSTLEDYEKSLSRKMRLQLKRGEKFAFEKESFVFTSCSIEKELPFFLEALFDLHSRRWRIRGKIGTFQKKPEEALFYCEFARLALENDWLGIMGLKNGNGFKAIQIGYFYNNIFYQLQEGFDPGCRHGMGNTLRMKIIAKCIKQGIKGYDFLGEMTRHKARWQAQARQGYDLLIYRRCTKNLPFITNRIWPTGRFLQPSKQPINNYRSE